MKKSVLIGLMGVAALMMSSCAKYVTDIYEARMVAATSPAPLLKPLTAELQLLSESHVSSTYTYSASEAVALGTIDNIRARSLCRMAEDHNADVIVGALFNINYTEGGTCKVVITGFPAKFVNWQTFQPSDTLYLKVNRQIDYQSQNPIIRTKQNTTIQ